MDTYLDARLFRDTLLESRLLSHEDLQFVEQKAHTENKSLPHTLLELGLLSQAEITKLIALTRGVSFVDLTKKHIAPETLEMIPEPISRTAGLVCFESSDTHLGVACVDLSAVEQIEGMHDKQVVPYLTDAESLKLVLKTYQKNQAETFGEQITSQLRNIRNPESFKSHEEHVPHEFAQEIAEDLSTERLFKNVLAHAQTAQASHIYITPTEYDTSISYRIDGGLYDAMKLPESIMPSLVIKLRHMIDAPVLKKETARVVSGYAVAELTGGDISLQVLLFKTPHGTKAVVRLLPEGTLFDSLEYIVTSVGQQELVYKYLANSKMILVTGAKKTGVTRTYYGLLEHISAKQKEVMSLEDPIEVVLPRVSQLASNSKKDSKKLFMQTLQARPDVIGLSPFNLAHHAPVFAATKSGIQAVLEIDTMQNFITLLDNNKLFVPEIISAFNLIFSHATFRSVDIQEQKKSALTSSQIATVTKYISEGELIQFLHHEGVIDTGVKKLSEVSFTSRKKIPTRKRASQTYETLYVRGVTTVADILRLCGSITPTKVVFQKQVRTSEKRSVLENALLRSIAGEICIRDILKYLNN